MSSRSAMLLATLLALAGCDRGADTHDEADHGHEHPEASAAATEAPEDHDAAGSPDDGHGHDHGTGHDEGVGHDDHGGDDHGHAHGDDDAWAVTVWGAHFEIFAEADLLAAGEVSSSHTHVTALGDFSPLREGEVEVVIRREGRTWAFEADQPVRDGIFDIAVRPPAEGTYALFFRVRGREHAEEISAGAVRVGVPGHPGGLVEEPPAAGGEVVPFLKEQQWKTRFATAWAEAGELHQVARGPGLVRPVAGAELVLSAPMNAIVGGEPWPHLGREVAAEEPLFALTPHVASDRSLAELEALETEKHAALTLAEERLARLESLLEAQAASRAEVDAARANVTSLRAQHDAAERDLRTARAGRAGRAASGDRVSVVSPLAGQIADVRVRPGEVVTAGQVLGRVVRVAPYWVEVYLRPAEIAEIGDDAALALRGAGMAEPVSIPSSEVRLVSRSPEVNRTTGTVTCVFEVAGVPPMPLGSAVEAEVTLPGTRAGVIVPAGSIVDDAGTPVIYEQIDGEGFVRHEVRVIARQGTRLLVEGIDDGARVASAGGPAIRRAALASSGVGHGHVH